MTGFSLRILLFATLHVDITSSPTFMSSQTKPPLVFGKQSSVMDKKNKYANMDVIKNH